VVCYNGGTCSGSRCICPSGFTGQRCELSAIYYQNNTFTDIFLTVNGTNITIPAGTSVEVSGVPGYQATADAYTHGTYGETLSWHYDDYFPSGSGGQLDAFNVSTDYFYLMMANDDPFSLSGLYVNYGNAAETYESIAIPADRVIYGIGYYAARASTRVSVNFSVGGYYTSSYLNIPYVLNASYTVYIP
jgi:hypothetical protein